MCGARYKTRPGLTYHYGHSHKEGASDENSRESNAPNPSLGQVGAGAPPVPPTGAGAPPAPPGVPPGGIGGPSSLVAETASSPNPGNVYQDSYVSFLNHPAGTAFFFFYFFPVSSSKLDQN